MKKILFFILSIIGILGITQSYASAEPIPQNQCTPNRPCLYSGGCYYIGTDGNYHKANLWITVQKNNQGTIVATVSQSNYTNIPNGSSYTVQGCRKGGAAA